MLGCALADPWFLDEDEGGDGEEYPTGQPNSKNSQMTRSGYAVRRRRHSGMLRLEGTGRRSVKALGPEAVGRGSQMAGAGSGRRGTAHLRLGQLRAC